MKERNNTPHLFDTFTGNKTPELAIFYNLAHDNIKKFIQSIDGRHAGKKLTEIIGNLSDEVFARLREYIWKGGIFNKNDEGHTVTPDEKQLIKELLCKLNGLRNFQSHYWHDSAPLKLSNILVHFIEDYHEIAFAKLMADHSRNSRLYATQRSKYPFFKSSHNNKFLTLEGRVFFLSFFLTRGEMDMLLSQTKGSKQNNTPDFKLKREIYTYFCHREGSSWENIGVQNEELEQTDAKEQDRILKGRQSYKILNYLNDVPEADWPEIPLLFEDNGRPVFADNIENLLRYIKAKRLMSRLGFYSLELTQDEDDEEKSSKELNEEKKEQERKQREGWAGFTYEGKLHKFEIGFKALLQITQDCLRKKQMEYKNPDGTITTHTAEEHFYKVLDDCITIREHFYSGLKNQNDEPLNPDNFKLNKIHVSVFVDYSKLSDTIQDVSYTPDQLRNLPLLTTPKAEKKLIEWHDSFIRKKTNEVSKRKALLNLIRPANVPFDKSIYEGTLKNGKPKVVPPNTDPEPLIFHLALYYKEQPQKNRGDDRFVEWAAKYMYDFNLAPGWYWEMEKLVYEKKTGKMVGEGKLKKELLYEIKPPKNFRVRVHNKSVVIGFPKTNSPKTSKDFYKFRIDERAMKTLFAAHYLSGGGEKSIVGFLNTIKADYIRLLQKDQSSLQLLDQFAIPEFLGGAGRAKQTTLKSEVKQFLKTRIDWINKQLANSHKLNRNAKNKIILDTYRFFDFSKTNGKKFLRKNEYQQMSIVHFMMMQNRKESENIFNRHQLGSRLPDAIVCLMNEARDMNDLFEWVLENRKHYFSKLLEGLKTFSDNDLRALIKPLGIKLPQQLLVEEDKTKRETNRIRHREDIPFIIHPLLALKHFYPNEFKDGTFNPNVKLKAHRNIFKELREASTGHLLIKENYNTDINDLLMPSGLIGKLIGNDRKKITNLKKKLNGERTDHHTKDILLWKMGAAYLQAYDSTLYNNFIALMADGPVKPSELFKTAVPVKLQKSSVDFSDSAYTEQEKAAMPETIHLELLMHQVDDYFFRSQHSRLYQLALHFINRRREELELYKERADIVNKIKEWPDGSPGKPVKLGDLINERKICAGLGRELLQYILDFERRIINGYCNRELQMEPPGEMNKIKNKKQALLESYARPGNKYVDFKNLNNLVTEKINDTLFKKIKTLRNQCLHSALPLTGSYRQLSMPGSDIAELLHITNRLGKDRTETSPYEQQEKIEGPVAK